MKRGMLPACLTSLRPAHDLGPSLFFASGGEARVGGKDILQRVKRSSRAGDARPASLRIIVTSVFTSLVFAARARLSFL